MSQTAGLTAELAWARAGRPGRPCPALRCPPGPQHRELGLGASPSLATDLLCALRCVGPSCLSFPSCKPTQRRAPPPRAVMRLRRVRPMGTQVFATFTNLQSACCVSDIESFTISLESSLVTILTK